MRNIKIEGWDVTVEGKPVKENLLVGLNVLIANKKPEEIPKGIDKFRLFGRLAKAFERAEKTNILELEEGDYSFLKKTIENDIPSIWAMNSNMLKAVEEFLNSKEE